MNDDIRRRLEDAGRAPVPGPDPAFADALEARLLAVAAEPAAGRPARRRGAGVAAGRRRAGLGIAVAAVGGCRRRARWSPPGPPRRARCARQRGGLAGRRDDPRGPRRPPPARGRRHPRGGGWLGAHRGRGARSGRRRHRVATVASRSSVPPRRCVPGSHRDQHAETRCHATAHARAVAAAVAAADGNARSADDHPRRPRRPRPHPTSTPATPAPARTDAPPNATPTPTPTPAIVRPRLRARLITGPRVGVTWTATWRAPLLRAHREPFAPGPGGRPRLPGLAGPRRRSPHRPPRRSASGFRRASTETRAAGDRPAPRRIGPAPEPHRDPDHPGPQPVATRRAGGPAPQVRRLPVARRRCSIAVPWLTSPSPPRLPPRPDPLPARTAPRRPAPSRASRTSSAATATSRSARWPRPCSSPWSSAARCSSRARPASARRSSPRSSRRASARG